MTPDTYLSVLATSLQSEVRWSNLPPAWVLVMVVVPAALLLGWWAYRAERDLAPHRRLLLGALRSSSILVFLVLLFGPFAEVREQQSVRAHLLILLDVSDSMSTIDGYEPEDASALARSTGLSVAEVTRQSRLDLAKLVFLKDDRALLKRLSEQFRVHVLTFGSRLTPVVSARDTSAEPTPEEEADDQKIASRIAALRPVAPATRLGQAVGTALDMFHYRDEPVAGVVVISDGQQNGGTLTPLQAGQKADVQHVPVFAVGVGDPRSPKNLHVSNLRAKEVVLARDTTVFEFTVRGKGFENRNVPVEIQQLGGEGEAVGSPLLVTPSEIVLQGGDEEQTVKVAHRFVRAGTFTLRIGIPVQDEEKIKSDNYVLHTIRVIDRKIKVLYVDGRARREYEFLSNALVRDTETVLAHILLRDADPGMVQRATIAPDWRPLVNADGIPEREKLFDYDVIILGDVDPRKLGATSAAADEALENLREFVDKGGGLLVIAGPQDTPTKYLSTPVEDLLPIVIDRNAERADPRLDPGYFFPLKLTPDGRDMPLMDIARDPEESFRIWEHDPKIAQHWAYPALRAKTVARVLLVSGDVQHENRYGPRPLIATLPFGRGRTLYVGFEDFWSVRYDSGVGLFYSFYGEAVRFLATYKLLGGNRRFKILTDRDQYTLDDQVRITLDVLDREYQPSREPSQKVLLDMPGEDGGTRETVEIDAKLTDDKGFGTYTATIVPTRPGDYRLYTKPDDPEEDAPEKLFHVVRSSLEGRNLLLDETSLRDLAESSAKGGKYLHLKDIATDLDPAPKTQLIDTDRRTTELWDNAWSLMVALLLLATEWLLRKRWHLV